jgi:hypothetical protein
MTYYTQLGHPGVIISIGLVLIAVALITAVFYPLEVLAVALITVTILTFALQ